LTETNTAAARMSADPDSRAVAVAAARAASDKQASRIVILDVREPIVITDYFVICTASSTRQIRTVIDEIERATREMGVKPMRREGESETGWWLLAIGITLSILGSLFRVSVFSLLISLLIGYIHLQVKPNYH